MPIRRNTIPTRSRTAPRGIATTAALAALLGLGLAACGSDGGDAADTTVAATSAPETSAPETSAPETSAAPEVQAAPETAAAATVAPDTGPSTTLSPEAADAALTEGLVQALSGMGVKDPATAAACVRKESPELTLDSLLPPSGPGAGLLRGLIRCASDELAAQGSASMKVQGLTDAQKACAAKAALLTLADQDDARLTELMSRPAREMPDDVLEQSVARAADCGLTRDQIVAAIRS
jgi:hypothetical protein